MARYRPIQYLGWEGPYRALRTWGLTHPQAANAASRWWESRQWEAVERQFLDRQDTQELIREVDVRFSSSGRMRLDDDRAQALRGLIPGDTIIALQELQGEFRQAIERCLADFVAKEYGMLLGPLAQEQSQVKTKAKGRKSRPKA